ncbi:Stk1 family PASTA domain-containing Ser/Thr kinase [Streptomyces alkaliterrae]|uniref:non-specific serine/threonine protein kinase n=1 Tax=Streptomyces alkaliterrae TaxID=2213162 RepID=A0A5P0YLF4_9ACTN|nr:Stk1 family PASTA domain-containing Ser/Thr kinase [Streptomyces alkaliterrae]MBB1258536.1 Stk1 family PASTA domain-containing Ser/Thr kinase [Streptomyces alkaliterrae]MQS00467.1 Stk1 family PASTA domain-containing Ser/Thr kinase [Streptomyces alkaliterrae]
MDEPRRLGGRYELGQVLGRGGMAEVYLGHDTRLGRTVAVKTLRADLARDPTFQARFRREAQSAASLNHPAIVAVYDTGEDYVDGVSIPYIVMEYVDGSTLRELLHSGRKLLPERALEMCIGILQALEYSHRNGIVHRDIKPANVMLTRTGQVKVMDFGIARAMGDAGMTMTQTAAVIGTAQYLSPEQAKGETVDARSDLYSTGCLIYELLTVRPPFIGDSPVAVAYQHVREEPQPPSAFDPELTPEMDAIVLKALAKDPDYRYQSADEMRADIEALLDGQPVGAVAAPVPVGYGHAGNPEDRPTQALRAAEPRTSMLPPVRDDDGGFGYDEPRGRRGGQKKSNLSTILLVVGAALVLIGAVFLGKVIFSGTAAGGDTEVPKLVGLSLPDAKNRAENVGFQVQEGGSEHCDEDKGLVCSTNPAAGTKAPRDSVITLTMSKGPAPVEVPDVTGQDADDARKTLSDAGFKVEEKAVASGTEDEGTVTEQDPSGGTKVQKDSTVTISVVRTVTRTVPSVIGKSFDDAKQQLEAIGFVVAKAEREDGSVPADQVLNQNPGAGSQAAPNSQVTLTVAKAPEQQNVRVPDVSNQELKDARKTLEQAGLKVEVQGPDDGKARVFATNPVGGTEVPKDSTVRVFTIPGGGDNGDGGGDGDDDEGGFIRGPNGFGRG